MRQMTPSTMPMINGFWIIRVRKSPKNREAASVQPCPGRKCSKRMIEAMVMAGKCTAMSSDKYLEPFLPEDAQRKRNAEQDQVGKGSSHAADHAGLRIATEHPVVTRWPTVQATAAAEK